MVLRLHQHKTFQWQGVDLILQFSSFLESQKTVAFLGVSSDFPSILYNGFYKFESIFWHMVKNIIWIISDSIQRLKPGF